MSAINFFLLCQKKLDNVFTSAKEEVSKNKSIMISFFTRQTRTCIYAQLGQILAREKI